ncbi:hypothetical protein GCM10009864_20080 [Streptomyces lunalinharesii]|uniref:Uncharacterized protein n=1 Tax=Streptomyces lunalinharesii TaxID=333384 RepID=A0ABN3RKS9_9ACTN
MGPLLELAVRVERVEVEAGRDESGGAPMAWASSCVPPVRVRAPARLYAATMATEAAGNCRHTRRADTGLPQVCAFMDRAIDEQFSNDTLSPRR